MVSIVIVGGGTSGWLTAAFLSQQLPQTIGRAVSVTLVEASDIPTIGVGEATIPSIRQTLAACGINEYEFMAATDGTFKQGIKFAHWRHDPASHPNDDYFHPFGDCLAVNGVVPARIWSGQEREKRGEFAEVFSVQHEMAEGLRAPKNGRDGPYQGALSYAYHLDAGKLAQYLKERFRAIAVRHIIGKVTEVAGREDGGISEITLENGEKLSADLFIDCTGFASRLINADGQNTFISKAHQLFVDRAITTRVATDDVSAIKPYTTSTAQTSGWIWDIGLTTRRGIGHVFSTRHIDDDGARAQLATYLGKHVSEIETRTLDMRIGYHSQQWRGNCVAVGLSSGFLEPLESTGIYLVEMANWALADLVGRFLSGADARDRYNQIMANHYENITDFLKLHYCLSGRRDSQFWRDNVAEDSVPDTLKTHLANWADNVPSIYDFDRTTQCFSATNYLFVLFGMGWTGHRSPRPLDEAGSAMMEQLALRRARLKQFVLRDTMPHGQLLGLIHAQK